MLRVVRLALLLTCTVGLAPWGCAHCTQHGSIARRESTTDPRLAPDELALAERSDFDFDVSAVSSLDLVDAALGDVPLEERELRSLSPRQCQCFAARHSTLGNLLASERRSVESAARSSEHGLDASNKMQMEVLRQSALEARNRTASGALELYYKLVEAEATILIVDESLREMDRILVGLHELSEQELPQPLDASEFERRRIQLTDKRVQLESGIRQLNDELADLIGLQDSAHAVRLWPESSWQVTAQPMDAKQAVQLGLTTRHELQAIEMVSESLTAETLPAARRLLGGIHGLMGVVQSGSPGGLLALRRQLQQPASIQEVRDRQRQIELYHARRSEEIESEIRRNLEIIELRTRQVAVAEETRVSWQSHLKDLEQQREMMSGTSFVDLSLARLKLLDAQSAEVSAVVAWRIAHVKLRQSQGLLIEECLAQEDASPATDE